MKVPLSSAIILLAFSSGLAQHVCAAPYIVITNLDHPAMSPNFYSGPGPNEGDRYQYEIFSAGPGQLVSCIRNSPSGGLLPQTFSNTDGGGHWVLTGYDPPSNNGDYFQRWSVGGVPISDYRVANSSESHSDGFYFWVKSRPNAFGCSLWGLAVPILATSYDYYDLTLGATGPYFQVLGQSTIRVSTSTPEQCALSASIPGYGQITSKEVKYTLQAWTPVYAQWLVHDDGSGRDFSTLYPFLDAFSVETIGIDYAGNVYWFSTGGEILHEEIDTTPTYEAPPPFPWEPTPDPNPVISWPPFYEPPVSA